MESRCLLAINRIALVAILTAFPRALIGSDCKSINADQTTMLVSPASTVGTITHAGFLNGSTEDASGEFSRLIFD